MIENIITLFMLILLQAVLGFDNLLYISLESKRAPKEKQRYVRKLGIALAVILRIVMLLISLLHVQGLLMLCKTAVTGLEMVKTGKLL